MKHIIRFAWLLALVLPACISGAGGKGKIRVWGELRGLQRDSVFIYRIMGNEMQPLASAPNQEGKFEIKVDVPGNGLYFLGPDPTYGALILLGDEEEVEVNGEANSIGNVKLISPGNEAIKKFTEQAYIRNSQLQQLTQQVYYARQGSPAQVPALENDLSAKAEQNIAWLDSVAKGSDFTAKLAPFFMYRPFTSQLAGQYGDEITFYKEENLNFIRWDDPQLPFIPYFAANVAQYFESLAGNGVKADEIIRKYKMYQEKISKNTPDAQAMYTLAALTGLSNGNPLPPNPDAYLGVYELYKKQSPKDAKMAFWTQKSDMLIGEKKRQAAFSEGAEAPDFRLPDPNGKMVALSDLRGKVVLVDFWASWCGPCRMENPNVVKMYAKYKDKGFEILGVSLDKEKGAWLQAIQQDGLTWKHVSDLKYWQSEAARLYNVTGIPMTFLIGKDGKILAKNLRGPALENKLKELFN